MADTGRLQGTMDKQSLPPLLDFFKDIEKYGKAKEAWLKKFLPLEHGVYRRVFTRLKSEAIASCFMIWVRTIKRDISREIAD
jgi:hypothetical protein